MADTKISALTELTDPDDGDWLPIVDTSTAATKKISPTNFYIGTSQDIGVGRVVKPVGADNTGQINDAITYCLANNVPLCLVPDTYTITSTIDFTANASFDSLTVLGAQSGYFNNGQTETLFDLSAITSGNAIQIASARNFYCADVAFRGDTGANGIVIDPSGTTSGSSIVGFERCRIESFDTGYICNDEAASQNADRCYLNDVQIGGCTIGVSYGQDQSRANVIKGGHIGNVTTGISGVAHGEGNGTNPTIWGTQFDTMERMFDVVTAYGHPLSVIGVHAERVGGIGTVGVNAAARQSAIFSGCSIDLSALNAPATTDTYCLDSGCIVLFDACALGTPNRSMRCFAVEFRGTGIGTVEVEKSPGAPTPNAVWSGFNYPFTYYRAQHCTTAEMLSRTYPAEIALS